MDKNTLRLGWWLLGGLLFGGASVTGVLLAKEIENRYFPVVNDVNITIALPDGDGVLLSGTFNKRRDCHFVEANASAGDLPLDLEFRDQRKNRAINRPVGPQVFGPWRISPTAFPLRIVVRHECHPLWFSTTTMLENYKP